MRVERGAVTERVVRRAANDGARLVLAPAAVLTPLGRELAGSLHVEIERERRC
jgi:predicted amidohydrolase